MLTWRIYYDDYTTFDNTQGSPNDAPALGVICIALIDEDVGKQILNRWDYYYYNTEDNEWCGGDLQGILDQFCQFPHTRQALKQGRTINTTAYKEIMARAWHDADFPKKSATGALETKKGNL